MKELMSLSDQNNNVSVAIVKAIMNDVYGRYGLEQYFRSLKTEIQNDIYETWIQIVLEELNKANWESIDKIADENGGHYVVPFPNDVDIKMISNYIQKIKKERKDV
jgi:hypothetical protein